MTRTEMLLVKGNKVICLVTCQFVSVVHFSFLSLHRNINEQSFSFHQIMKDGCSKVFFLCSCTECHSVFSHCTTLGCNVSAEIKTDPGSAGPARSHECPPEARWETQLTCHHGNCTPLEFLPFLSVFLPLLASERVILYQVTSALLGFLSSELNFKERRCRIYCAGG